MANPTRIEIDCSTGVETIIELTDAEVAELEAQAAVAEQERQAREAELAAAEAAKASAQSKLAALGLTPEEIAALSK